MLLGSAIFFSAEQVSETQTKSDNTQSKQDDDWNPQNEYIDPHTAAG